MHKIFLDHRILLLKTEYFHWDKSDRFSTNFVQLKYESVFITLICVEIKGGVDSMASLWFQVDMCCVGMESIVLECNAVRFVINVLDAPNGTLENEIKPRIKSKLVYAVFSIFILVLQNVVSIDLLTGESNLTVRSTLPINAELALTGVVLAG